MASTVSLVSCSIGFGYTPVIKISTTITDKETSTGKPVGEPLPRNGIAIAIKYFLNHVKRVYRCQYNTDTCHRCIQHAIPCNATGKHTVKHHKLAHKTIG